MNRKEAAELLPIIKAFSEGKEIEGLYKGTKSPWFKIKDMDFNEGIIFRINKVSDEFPGVEIIRFICFIRVKITPVTCVEVDNFIYMACIKNLKCKIVILVLKLHYISCPFVKRC